MAFIRALRLSRVAEQKLPDAVSLCDARRRMGIATFWPTWSPSPAVATRFRVYPGVKTDRHVAMSLLIVHRDSQKDASERSELALFRPDTRNVAPLSA